MADRQICIFLSTRAATGCYKIGRTGSYENRLRELNAGRLLDCVYVAQYDDWGHLEMLVHDELAPFRLESTSHEWFEIGVEHIDNVIRTLQAAEE